MYARLTFNVPTDLRQRARTLATARGETIAEIVRAALEKYIAEQEFAHRTEPELSYLREGAPVFDPAGLAQGRYADAEVTEALNLIYATESSSMDPILMKGQLASIGWATLSLAEIQAWFHSEWVLLEDPETTPSLEVQGGRVLWHSKDRDEVYRKAKELHPKFSAVLFTGQLPEEAVVIL